MTEGDIKAADTSYWDFFNKESQAHLIPTLQRPYTWGRVQVEQLWNDIVDSEDPYYIGSVVAIGAGRSTRRDEILDGQQRLTTLSLILIAIRNAIKTKKGLDDVRKDILSMLSKPTHGSGPEVRLAFSNSNSNSVYSALVKDEIPIVDKRTRTQENFIGNLQVIIDLLKAYSPKLKPSEITLLVEKIKNLQIVFISCENRAAAYKLFESINATSVTLASTDLIKNRIFSLTNKMSPKSLEDAERKWSEIEMRFNEDRNVLKTFIRHHWISLGRYTSHAKLFKDFEDYLEEEEGGAVEYLDSLLAASKTYLALRNATIDGLDRLPKVRFEREEIRQGLEFLSFLGVDQVYPVLLYLYENDAKNFKKDLNRLIAFQFLFKYVPGSPSEPEKKYFAAFTAEAITKQDMFVGLSRLCRNHKDNFKQRLLQRWRYKEGRSGDIQFVLEKYLYHFGKPRSFKAPTIEHIISQAAEQKMLKNGAAKKEALDILHSLGNLTVLEKQENSEDYQDKPFKQKKPLYKRSLFKANNKICEYKFDTSPQIAVEKRGAEVADKIYDIFMRTLETGKWA